MSDGIKPPQFVDILKEEIVNLVIIETIGTSSSFLPESDC